MGQLHKSYLDELNYFYAMTPYEIIISCSFGDNVTLYRTHVKRSLVVLKMYTTVHNLPSCLPHTHAYGPHDTSTMRRNS